MEHTISQKPLEIKMAGLALECGTLDVLLRLLQPQTSVFLTPLTFAHGHGAQYKQFYVVHVTARPAPSGPILYATFHAALVLRLADHITLIEPYHMQGKEAASRAHDLQQELQSCLKQLIEAHPTIGTVILPARLRLPDAWAWGVRSLEPRIYYQRDHWTIDAKDNGEGTTKAPSSPF